MGKKYIIELENDQIINGHIACPMQIGYRDRPSFFIDTGIDIAHYTEPDIEQVKADAYLAGLKDGQGVTIESQQNNAFNDGYKKCLKDLEQVRKEAYEQGRRDGKIEKQAEWYMQRILQKPLRR